MEIKRYGKADETIFFDMLVDEGDDPDSVVKLDEMLKKYYKIRGWDKEGIPTQKTLRKLKL